MKPNHVAIWAILAMVFAALSAAQEPIVYNQSINVPLPAPFISDFKFVDWDRDGKTDLLTLPQRGRLYLHRNVGTRSDPIFENGFERDRVVIRDSRIGRFFDLMDFDGDGRKEIIAFERHQSVREIGKRRLKLHIFRNAGQLDEPSWSVLQVKDTQGDAYESTADVWMGPTVEVVDWDDDGKEDLIVGMWHPGLCLPEGNVLDGFRNPPEAYNPYAGRLYFIRNVSRDGQPFFEPPVLIESEGEAIKCHGWAYPKTLDVDGDGLVDLIVGEHRPGLRVYRNVGARGKPELIDVGLLEDDAGRPIRTILSIHPEAADLNGNGKPELITTSYFAFTFGFLVYEHTGAPNLESGWRFGGYLPTKSKPATPVAGQGIVTIEPCDWDGDGDHDLLLGAEPGVPLLARNVGSDDKKVFAAPERLRFVDGRPLEIYCIQVGRGSCWGPIEHYFDRIAPRVADWDEDGTPDIISGSMGLRLLWLKGARIDGELRFHEPRTLMMRGQDLDVAQRVQPSVLDWDGDGHLDIVALDEKNYVTVYLGDGTSVLTSAQPLLLETNEKIMTNGNYLGVGSGRRGLAMVDWNKDRRPDLLIYTPGRGFEYYRNTGESDDFRFAEPSLLFRSFAGHNGGVTPFDWDSDGILDILTAGDPGNLLNPAGSGIPKGHLFVVKGEMMKIPPKPR